MRHVPTALYIDTQVYVKQGYRLDTKDFSSLKERFKKGSLRLVMPAVMERELLRKYKEQAEKCADTVQKTHPLTLLIGQSQKSRDEIVNACFEQLVSQFNQFKSHFIVESLPLGGDLERVFDWYFERRPPFSNPNKPKEFPDAFIFCALDAYHNDHQANIAVISGDSDFPKACSLRPFIWHFDSLEQYIKAFQPELSAVNYLIAEPVDPTQPIVTEDLTELKAILYRGSSATPIEVDRVMLLLGSRGENYNYFFSNAKSPVWLQSLKGNGFFDQIPDMEDEEDGHYKIPNWPPIYYLERILSDCTSEVLQILEELPKTTNPIVLEQILKIVMATDDGKNLLRFRGRIEALFESKFCRGYDLIVRLIGKLSLQDASLGSFSSEVVLKSIEFLPDPQAEVKQEQRRADPEAYGTLLEPSPRFGAWEYSEILEKGVRPLAEREPYQTARILIDAMSAMLRLRIHQSDWDDGYTDDHSSIWCERLTEPTRNYEDPKADLVRVLTYACEQVFLKDPAAVAALDQALRNQRWDIFKRIRQHLYAENPNEQTQPWIRETILMHGDYGKWEYRFEFQRMIRCACERFGPALLSEEERENIFKTIQDGPSKEEYRQQMGDKYSEEGFESRKRYFHSRQFAPFATVLFTPFKEYYQELVASEAKPVTDNDYAPFKSEGVKNGEQRSPVPLEELKRMSDEELLALINEWDDAHHDSEKWWVDINISALACEFQTLFSTSILFDKDRLKFWFDNRARVARPIYVKKMVLAAHERIKSKNFDQLEIWFDLCDWILSHPDMDKAEAVRRGDETRENPSWRSARRAAGDFVGICLEKDIDIPISARPRLANILETLCTDFDRRLDNDEPVLLNRDDQLTEAINNTRSRALEDLLDFGFWVRRQLHDEQAAVPEVFSILEKRMGATRPLTLPEHALLGLYYGRIFTLDADWAKRHKDWLFPQGNLRVWMEAFDLFLRHSRPYKPLFLVVQDDMEFALENIPQDKAENNKWKTLVDSLGDHLFTYYLWGIFPLTGDASLLARFYEQTKHDDGRWAHLFDRIGRNLKNSGKQLDEALKDKVIEFFDWRCEQKNPAEMKEFTFWLGAECLDAEWRLKAFSRTLDVSKADDVKTSICLETLRKLLDEYPALVVECFAKLTDSASKDRSFYVQPDKAKPILQLGLKSQKELVRKNAERARENLLRAGRFVFLDVDTDSIK